MKASLLGDIDRGVIAAIEPAATPWPSSPLPIWPLLGRACERGEVVLHPHVDSWEDHEAARSLLAVGAIRPVGYVDGARVFEPTRYGRMVFQELR